MTENKDNQSPLGAHLAGISANLIDLGVDTIAYARQISVGKARSMAFAIPDVYQDDTPIFVAFNADGTPLFAAESGAALALEVRKNDFILLPTQ